VGGYARLPTGDQNPDCQVDVLRRAAAKASRPQFDLVMKVPRG
jgi:hypothetical protein